jgi:hypothetical protein
MSGSRSIDGVDARSMSADGHDHGSLIRLLGSGDLVTPFRENFEKN